MLQKFISFLSFLILLIKSGKPFLKAGIKSYHTPDNLRMFIPTSYTPRRIKQTTPSILNNYIIQTAFLKKSLRLTGGHLSMPNNSLSYIRIPKSANTSLSFAFLEKIYPTLASHELTDEQINYVTDRNLSYEVNKKNSSDIYFTVVRNPFIRIVSVYRDFFEGNHQDFIYQDYLFGVINKHFSFDEFLNRVAKIPDFLKDQHLRPQHLFLKYYQIRNSKIHVFKLEDKESIQQFLKPYGIHVPHRNRSTSYDVASYYTFKSLQLVNVIYKKDIELFGYTNQYQELLKHVVKS
jgi:hypothetical protein